MHMEPTPTVQVAVKTVLPGQSFARNSAFLCVNDVVVNLPCRLDTIKVFFRKVNTNKYIINTVLTSS